MWAGLAIGARVVVSPRRGAVRWCVGARNPAGPAVIAGGPSMRDAQRRKNPGREAPNRRRKTCWGSRHVRRVCARNASCAYAELGITVRWIAVGRPASQPAAPDPPCCFLGRAFGAVRAFAAVRAAAQAAHGVVLSHALIPRPDWGTPGRGISSNGGVRDRKARAEKRADDAGRGRVRNDFTLIRLIFKCN